jgi:hypothetical protein
MRGRREEVQDRACGACRGGGALLDGRFGPTATAVMTVGRRAGRRPPPTSRMPKVDLASGRLRAVAHVDPPAEVDLELDTRRDPAALGASPHHEGDWAAPPRSGESTRARYGRSRALPSRLCDIPCSRKVVAPSRRPASGRSTRCLASAGYWSEAGVVDHVPNRTTATRSGVCPDLRLENERGIRSPIGSAAQRAPWLPGSRHFLTSVSTHSTDTPLSRRNGEPAEVVRLGCASRISL